MQKKSSKVKWIFLSIMLIFSAIIIVNLHNDSKDTVTDQVKPYFGVSFNGNTTDEAKLLIDRTKDYTNVFVLQSGPISKNETAMNIVCDYAIDSSLDIIVFFGWLDTEQPWQIPWLTHAKNRWSDRFLGVYFFDEPGGLQLDYNWEYGFQHLKEVAPEVYQTMKQYVQEGENQTVVRDYELAKNRFIENQQFHSQLGIINNLSITAFTADYALYWFDYRAGYDTIFAELGWGHNVSQHIGLCRGAATVQNKDWGTIIVWNDLDPEDITKGNYKTGSEMLNDMLVSYETGADYIIIFNYPIDPPGNPYGILTDKHFEAMQQFWNYMELNPEEYGKTAAQVALVLPENYGWGMRSLDDKIWGYWGPDDKSEQIWEAVQYLIDRHGSAVDIIYDDAEHPIADIYQEIYYWDSVETNSR